MKSQVRIVVQFVGILLGWFIKYGSSTSSTSRGTDFSSYESVRALDSSGQSTQLKHAEAAADIQGRLLIALCRPEMTSALIICASGGENYGTYLRRHKNEDGLVRRITKRPVEIDQLVVNGYKRNRHIGNNSCSVYAICTGIQSDATWLIRELQLYARMIEERYGTHNPQLMAPVVVSMLKRSFWGYNNDIGWTGSGMSVLSINRHRDDDDDDSSSTSAWARPIGVKTILITYTPTSFQSHLQGHQITRNSCKNKLLVQMIDPAGIVHNIHQLVCIGKDSLPVQQELEKRFFNNEKGSNLLLTATDEEIYKIIQNVVANVRGTDPTNVNLQIEKISVPMGIEKVLWEYN